MPTLRPFVCSALLLAAPACAGDITFEEPPRDPVGDVTSSVSAPLKLLASDDLSLADVPDGPLLSRCDDAGKTTAEEVGCYFFEQGEFGSFVGREGVDVEYVKFAAQGVERATLVVVTGRTESYTSYAPFVYELTARNPQLGYTVYVLEHRGQGFSGGRLGTDPIDDAANWQKGYVADFEWYVEDMHTFMSTVVAPTAPERTFMLAHSMGGGIASRYMERYRDDLDLDAVVLSAPMNRIKLSLDQELLLNTVRAALPIIGKDYAVGQGPWEYGSHHSVSSDETRWAFNRRWNVDFPETRVGGTTYKWTVTSYDGANRSANRAWQIRVPVLLFQAGRDQIVDPGGQDRLCSWAKDCQLVRVENAEHEFLTEADHIRTPFVEQAIEYFESH